MFCCIKGKYLFNYCGYYMKSDLTMALFGTLNLLHLNFTVCGLLKVHFIVVTLIPD